MTQIDWTGLAGLLILWLAYFASHSVLASLAMKRWVASAFPNLMPYYRLTYNGLAVILLLPVLGWMFLFPGPQLWRWQGIGFWLANGLALAALYGFWRSLEYYDMTEFMGFRQLKTQTRRVEDQEHFHLSPFHRMVRHPWYFFGLILIWTRDMNAAMLLSAVMMSLYFLVGSRMEEKKLVVYHGEVYRRYMEKVPGLIPLPWKWLGAGEQQALEQMAQDD